MAADETFPRLMARLRSGEDAAAREVFETFVGRLVALARRRDATREAAGPDGRDEADAWLVALDREPRPEEAAILAETVERLFRDVSVHERPILELSLQGYTTPEISVRLGRAERSVRRLREHVRERLERLREAD